VGEGGGKKGLSNFAAACIWGIGAPLGKGELPREGQKRNFGRATFKQEETNKLLQGKRG